MLVLTCPTRTFGGHLLTFHEWERTVHHFTEAAERNEGQPETESLFDVFVSRVRPVRGTALHLVLLRILLDLEAAKEVFLKMGLVDSRSDFAKHG